MNEATVNPDAPPFSAIVNNLLNEVFVLKKVEKIL